MPNKRKGGQEKVCEKKRLLLLKSSKNCYKINKIFSKSIVNWKAENEDTTVQKSK